MDREKRKRLKGALSDCRRVLRQVKKANPRSPRVRVHLDIGAGGCGKSSGWRGHVHTTADLKELSDGRIRKVRKGTVCLNTRHSKILLDQDDRGWAEFLAHEMAHVRKGRRPTHKHRSRRFKHRQLFFLMNWAGMFEVPAGESKPKEEEE